MKQALCVSIEGIDGSGKSTLISALSKALTAAGIDNIQTREPGGTPAGEAIRNVVKSDLEMDDLTRALLFAASRRELLRSVIRPAKLASTWVLIDRFVDSMFVYQESATLPYRTLRQLHRMTADDYLPDCTLWVDTPVEIAYARATQRDSSDSLDRVDLARYQALRQRFYARFEDDDTGRIVRIDGSKSLTKMIEMATAHCLYRAEALALDRGPVMGIA